LPEIFTFTFEVAFPEVVLELPPVLPEESFPPVFELEVMLNPIIVLLV
jgi:hypothetical protein